MMKKFLLVLIAMCSLAVINLQAQGVAVDPRAKSILDKASAKFNSGSGLIAKLNVHVDNEQTNKKQNIPGVLSLKGNKFKLSLAGVETYYDRKTEYVYLIKEKEVNISTPKAEDLKETNPLLLLKSYKTGYKMSYVGSANVNGKLVDNVNLYPNDRTKSFSIITISIDKKTMLPVTVKAQGKNGINTTVTVLSYTYKRLPDPNFVYNAKAHKGVEVIDLR